MKSIVIGFAGKIASGKSTLSTIFAKERGWPYVSFGDYVRLVARQRGEDDSQREILQQTGASLVEQDCEGFCRAVLQQAPWQPGESLVIDGIRHLQVKQVLEKLVAPSKFVLIYISVDEQIRRQRLHYEGIDDPTRIERIESASTEIQAKAELPQVADFTLDYASFGNQVRSVARQRGLDDSQREILQQIGKSLIEQDYESFCRTVVRQAPNWESGKSPAIDGISLLEVKQTLEKFAVRKEFVLNYISSAPTEAQVRNEIPQIADITLDGAEQPEKLVAELKEKIFTSHVPKNDDPQPGSDLVKHGQRVYEKLKEVLEPQNHGRYVAIEPQSERFFLGDTGTEALVAAHNTMPNARFFLARIGYETAHRMGGHASRIRLG